MWDEAKQEALNEIKLAAVVDALRICANTGYDFCESKCPYYSRGCREEMDNDAADLIEALLKEKLVIQLHKALIIEGKTDDEV